MMNMFDINSSQRLAERRLGRSSQRRRRSDAGRSRLPSAVLAELREAALGHDRPSMSALHQRITRVCERHGLKVPVRASLYNALGRLEGHSYRIADLPEPVEEVLYNLDRSADVPGRQLAHYCFNYGSLAAISFAAGLPWLDLYQARRLRGWRPRSRGLLESVLRVRGIQ